MANDVSIGDAYARSDADGLVWTIGTKSVQVTFDGRDGMFRLVSFLNKSCEPPLEYVDVKMAAAPFAVDRMPQLIGDITIKSLWEKNVTKGERADPANDKLQVTVRKGDRLGFAVEHGGNYESTSTRWPVIVEYDSGERYDSTEDTALNQGPIWFYNILDVAAGTMAPLDEFWDLNLPHEKGKVRVPSNASGYRAAGNVPLIGPVVMHPSPDCAAVRIWVAPKDGSVRMKGTVEPSPDGGNPIKARVVEVRKTDPDARRALQAEEDRLRQWTLASAKGIEVNAGGRPAVQLDVTLVRGNILARFHVLTFPGTPILRQWVEIENTSAQPVVLKSPASACLRLRGDDASSYTNCWMIGGHASGDQGTLHQAPIASPYSRKLEGKGTANLVPWTALHRNQGSKDGWFLALEYLGNWSLAIEHKAGGALTATAAVPELKMRSLKPDERLDLPMVTFGVFRNGLDNMAASLYDWQYEYLWDYTNPDYYARIRSPTLWFWCSRNLQEQFTARLANLDMTADLFRALGYEMVWDDAGWSSFPGSGLPPNDYGSVFRQTYEGPDFAQTQRYLQKMGMRWLLWFSGRPPAGVLDTKVGAWGDFEWRTDAVDFPNMAADHGFREEVKRFLDAHPRSSFHTCSGGSTYAHTFEIGGRYATYNYLSDLGRGPQLNYYFSYLETPDRWGDLLELLLTKNRYVASTARSMLTAVPSPYGTLATAEDRELMRRNMELYRFLRSECLAGRWSYVAHPAIEGDEEYYYFQRTSHDRLKACIIPTRQAKGKVVIRPQGLVAERNYIVGLDSTQETRQRAGADLMSNGVILENPKPGELVYLNLPNRPGSGSDKVPPQSPGRVLVRRETNIGHGGIGLYWSPGADNNWISYYEVRRDGQTVDKVSIGHYYFDHAAGWDSLHEYAVRTVDGDGNASDWTVAQPTGDEPLMFAALGGHFSERGRDGWSAETSTNADVFIPMTWVPAARSPAADFGGTPNQSGGVEGYWEAKGGARIGRGWQQASKTECCVRAWTAPKAGTVRIAGRAMREYYHRAQGGPLKVKILHGNRQAWPERDWATVALGDLAGVAHNIKLDVAVGDVVRFVLDKGTVPEHDLIAWMPRIVYEETKSATHGAAVVRIICGTQTPYTDRCGNLWDADRHFTGGKSVSTAEKIEGATPTSEDQLLYQNGRAGKDFRYSIPVPAGLYAVRLKFAEPKHPWMFERPIDVDINGQSVLTDFDIVQAAKGPKQAVERSFRNVVPNSDGRIVLHFTAGWNPLRTTDDAMVQAIEVLPEQKPAIRINAGSDTEFVDWNSCVWTSDTYC